MTISSVQAKQEMGASGSEATFVTQVSFVGPADYEDGGLDESALLQAAVGKPVTPIAIIPTRSRGANPLYEPRIVLTPAVVDSVSGGFPVADQDGNTITYILNGAAEATLTLSGAHTTAAQLVTSIDAVAGLHAYIQGAEVRVKTDKDGDEATLQITGGTANAVYLFPTTEAVGSNTPRVLFVNVATGLDVGLGDDGPVDLSGTQFDCVLLSE